MQSKYSKWSPIAKMIEKGQWPPAQRETEAWFKFIEEQKYYFQNGYQIGGDKITGEHYWKLNFCNIGIGNERGAKVPTLPFYSDAQREFYDTYADICKTGENLLGVKGRDKGWTYEVADLALFQTQNIDFSEVLVVFPGGTSTAKANFMKAYDMAYNELDFDFKHPTLKKTDKEYVGIVKYGVEIEEINPLKPKEKTGIKKTIGPQTTLTTIVAVNSGVVRSGRCQLIIIEEIGEVNDLKEIIGVAQANLKEGARKLGPLIAGGTSNCFKNGFADLRDLWHHPEQFGFRTLFIPANKFYLPFVNLQTGESDLEGAKEDILKIRETKKGKDLIVHQQEHPLTIEEAFSQGLNSPFNPEYCNAQTARILSDNSISKAIQRGNYYAKKDGNGNIVPVWEIEPNTGRFLRFKGPDKTLKYPIVGGVDSYRMAEAKDSESKGAIELYVPYQGVNTPGSYPALLYWDRPADKEIFFMDCLMCAMDYEAKLLIELTDEDIITFFKTHNALKYLKERPNIIKSAYSKAENKYGVMPTVHNKKMALEYAVKEFNGNYDQIVFIELLDEMVNFGPGVNTDRVWAHNWAVLHAMDNMKVLEEYKKPVKERGFVPSTFIDERGQLVVVRTKEEAIRRGIIKGELTPKEQAMFGKSGNK